jgi:hypothetical protein
LSGGHHCPRAPRRGERNCDRSKSEGYSNAEELAPHQHVDGSYVSYSNDHLTAIRRRERAPSTTSKGAFAFCKPMFASTSCGHSVNDERGKRMVEVEPRMKPRSALVSPSLTPDALSALRAPKPTKPRARRYLAPDPSSPQPQGRWGLFF